MPWGATVPQRTISPLPKAPDNLVHRQALLHRLHLEYWLAVRRHQASRVVASAGKGGCGGTMMTLARRRQGPGVLSGRRDDGRWARRVGCEDRLKQGRSPECFIMRENWKDGRGDVRNRMPRTLVSPRSLLFRCARRALRQPCSRGRLWRCPSSDWPRHDLTAVEDGKIN